MPISFHRSLHALTSTISSMTGENLDHLYVARVELTHRTPLLVREGWTEVVQEQAVVGDVPPSPEREEADNPLSPATRFLCHLEEELVPWHFNYTVDSDGDYLHPHNPLQTIAHALRSGNLQPSITPITQVLASPKERDLNDNTPTGTCLITWPATPLWAKPRLVVGTRPPPRASSIETI